MPKKLDFSCLPIVGVLPPEGADAEGAQHRFDGREADSSHGESGDCGMMRQKMRVALWMGVILGAPALSLAGPVPPAITINPNYDVVVTASAQLNLGPLGYQPFIGVPLGTFDFGTTPNPPSGPPVRGIQDVYTGDTIIRRNSGGTLNSITDSFTTSIDVMAVCLKSAQPLDFGGGSQIYYATLDAGVNSGTMTIKGDGTWTNDFEFTVALRPGSKTATPERYVTKEFHGHGLWVSKPSANYYLSYPQLANLHAAIVFDPQADGDFFLSGPAIHDDGNGSGHNVIDIYSSVPEPSTGLLLLAGGVAVVWRKRKTRLAV
jgi:hypothetical protein